VTNRRRMAPGGGGTGGTAWAVPPGAPEPLIWVADDIEDEYPGASARHRVLREPVPGSVLIRLSGGRGDWVDASLDGVANQFWAAAGGGLVPDPVQVRPGPDCQPALGPISRGSPNRQGPDARLWGGAEWERPGSVRRPQTR